MSPPLNTTVRTGVFLWALGLTTAFASGCELQEITVAAPEDVVIIEGQVVVALQLAPGSGDPGPNTSLIASVFIHRTFGTGDLTVSGALVRIVDEGTGSGIILPEQQGSGCILPDPFDQGIQPPAGTCYRTVLTPSPFESGNRLSLQVTTSDGLNLTGTTQIPGSFSLEGLTHLGSQCRLPPETNYRISWTPSVGTWAYLGESNIFGLDAALGPLGIDAPEALFLDGLAIGQDTEIVFPAEFGVFDRFDLEAGLAQALQSGLPEGVRAEIAVSALDRNWINWARGGNFNPSGAVRVPSVFGDGTGVFGSGVRHLFSVNATANPSSPLPVCGDIEP